MAARPKAPTWRERTGPARRSNSDVEARSENRKYGSKVKGSQGQGMAGVKI
jgi:hypothetical protein